MLLSLTESCAERFGVVPAHRQLAIASASAAPGSLSADAARSGAPDSHADETDHDHAPDDWSTRLYHRVMEPLLDRARVRWAFLGGIVGLLALAGGLVLIALLFLLGRRIFNERLRYLSLANDYFPL